MAYKHDKYKNTIFYKYNFLNTISSLNSKSRRIFVYLFKSMKTNLVKAASEQSARSASFTKLRCALIELIQFSHKFANKNR